MKKAIFLFLVLAFTNAQAQIQRKLPIRKGGQTIDAGNIPESIHANDTTWNESHNAMRKRPGKVKYARITLRRGTSQGNLPINSDQFVAAVAGDAKITKVDAGNALNAIFSKLSESLNNGDNLQLSQFGENGNRPDSNNGSNARVADLKKLADELVNLVADEANLTMPEAGNVLNAFVANLSNTLRENDKEALSGDKPTYKNEIVVNVAENKALRFSLGDPDDDGDGLLDVSAVATDPQDSDGDGYGDYSVRKK
ncbi:MAG: HU family DNA-binding protein [Proteiniphilum sp.]|nr:HU family DNA-binding protein [Proteiniphilum sp.]